VITLKNAKFETITKYLGNAKELSCHVEETSHHVPSPTNHQNLFEPKTMPNPRL
jgi:hypothetical protein